MLLGIGIKQTNARTLPVWELLYKLFRNKIFVVRVSCPLKVYLTDIKSALIESLIEVYRSYNDRGFEVKPLFSISFFRLTADFRLMWYN